MKIEEFIHKESSSGILLVAATFLALALQNSPWSAAYEAILHIPVEVRFGDLFIEKTFNHWINDGLMAFFFLLIGLELKREMLEGQLSTPSKVVLPIIAAVGGMLVPALVYIFFNKGNDVAMLGWAIPTATDIAFALGVLSLLGSRVPVSLKMFLMALAIIDDLGAVVIIAFFYTAELSAISLTTAAIALIVLIIFNRIGIVRKAAYFIVGMALWTSVLKSGVHATLAGVLFAFTIPLTAKDDHGTTHSPLKEIEDGLHHWVAFLILPLFAFVNAGVNVMQISMSQMGETVPLGIMFGLLLGKQVGVFSFSWVAIQLKIAELPEGSSWMKFYGVCTLTGIGFTMSLFIDSLAFPDDSLFQHTEKLAILIGSTLSGIIGFVIIKISKTPKEMENENLINQFYYQVYNHKALDLIPKLFTDDCIFRGSIGQEKRGHEGIAEYVTLITDALGDFESTIHQVICENQNAYARIRFAGHHQGEFMGYAPSGKSVSWIGTVEFQFKNGLISELWALGDLHGLVQQLRTNDAPTEPTSH